MNGAQDGRDTSTEATLVSLSDLAAQIRHGATRASLRVLARERQIALTVVRKVDLLTAGDAARLKEIYMKDHAPFNRMYSRKKARKG